MRARGAITLALVVSVVLPVAAARADLRYHVVLLRPLVTDDVTSDALARVHGELTAAGFEVSMLPQDPAFDVRTALESVGRELNPIGAFAIVRPPGGNTAEIWVCDRMAGKSIIQSVHLDEAGVAPGQSRSVVLAVHAVELLKASLAKYWLAAVRQTEPPPPEPPPAPSTLEPADAYAVTGIGLEAGVGWLDSIGDVTAVWQLVVRASYGGTHGWAGRFTAGGFGTDAELHAPAGNVQLRQQVATVELVRAFRPGKRLQFVASIGAGVYHARITGTGADPQATTGHVTDAWSVLALAGAGVVIRIAGPLSLTVDGQVGLTWPENLIRIVGTEAGHTGRPTLLASAGALATF
jgi:hypothetical protein